MGEDTRTISFVAREELAEWIEQEAERRMTTVSSAAQQLLAEQYRKSTSEDSASSSEDSSDPLKEFSDYWREPDSLANDYAVRVPEDADKSDAGSYRYYKTADGARKALRRFYS